MRYPFVTYVRDPEETPEFLIEASPILDTSLPLKRREDRQF